MRREDERGTVILEWSIGITFCIFILMFFLSFSIFLYQKVMVKVAANEAAEIVAETYKFGELPDPESISKEDITKIGLYRYLLPGKLSDRHNAGVAKATRFFDDRLTKATLAKDNGGLSVKVERKVDDIGRCHYVVTVSKGYTFLFGKLLRAAGQKETEQLSAQAVTSDFDASYYINTIKFTKYALKKAQGLSTIVGAVNSLIELVNSTFKIGKSLTGD